MTKSDIGRHDNCVKTYNPNSAPICDCEKHRTNYQRACNCWNCENCGKRHSCHDWMTMEDLCKPITEYEFVVQNKHDPQSSINYEPIIEGFTSYIENKLVTDNPYDSQNLNDEFNFMYWYYGWLQGYYQDKEGITYERK